MINSGLEVTQDAPMKGILSPRLAINRSSCSRSRGRNPSRTRTGGHGGVRNLAHTGRSRSRSPALPTFYHNGGDGGRSRDRGSWDSRSHSRSDGRRTIQRMALQIAGRAFDPRSCQRWKIQEVPQHLDRTRNCHQEKQ